MPTIGFAPDADFPIINAEKGIASLTFKQKNEASDGLLLKFQSGNRTNMVPDFAEAHISEDALSIRAKFESFLLLNHVNGEIRSDSGHTVVTITGKSAHAMEPDNGVNAAILLATFLNDFFQEGKSKRFTQFIVNAFSNDSRGHALGLSFKDDISGDTTLNAGIVSFDQEKGGEIKVSMRYSVTYPFEEKMSLCKSQLDKSAFTVELGSNSTPHHVDANDPLIHTLQEVYTTHTGEEATLLSIGGGTYARVLEKGVAFGMLFPGREDIAHQSDEYVYIDDMVKATAIYADAISRLACDNPEGERQ